MRELQNLNLLRGKACPEKRMTAIPCARGSEADYVSPVGASIYCSPHPAALQIDPPSSFGNFASMISRTENSQCDRYRRGHHPLAAICSGTTFSADVGGMMENHAFASLSRTSCR